VFVVSQVSICGLGAKELVVDVDLEDVDDVVERAPLVVVAMELLPPVDVVEVVEGVV
jgi:hypothetical protein